MEIIRNSKEPTIKRMEDIIANLQEKFSLYTSLSVNVGLYSGGERRNTFWLYVEQPVGGKTFTTWPALLSGYRKLMREGKL